MDHDFLVDIDSVSYADIVKFVTNILEQEDSDVSQSLDNLHISK